MKIESIYTVQSIKKYLEKKSLYTLYSFLRYWVIRYSDTQTRKKQDTVLSSDGRIIRFFLSMWVGEIIRY
jgi:hypothetical protein